MTAHAGSVPLESVLDRPRPAIKSILGCLLCSVVLTEPLPGAQTDASLSVTTPVSLPDAGVALGGVSPLEARIGQGFRPTTQSIGLSAGVTSGFSAFGSVEAQDLALLSLSYGRMLGRVSGEGYWYRGNPEFRFELFAGAQYSPSTEWLVGLTPHLRYNFATGTRWIPFIDAGAGVTATGIGPPDLSGTFEFNLQAGGGIQLFIIENVALTLDMRCVHWSCAGISQPNLGLNGVTGMLGLAFYLGADFMSRTTHFLLGHSFCCALPPACTRIKDGSIQ